MSSAGESIATILILDVVFAMATGMTGIHSLIVDAGAALGEQAGITPLFGAEAHAGHSAGGWESAAANDNFTFDNDNFVPETHAAGECHFHGTELICH